MFCSQNLQPYTALENAIMVGRAWASCEKLSLLPHVEQHWTACWRR